LLATIDIKEPAAAAVFANLRQRQVLMTLIEREYSLSQLAEQTGTPLNLLHHQIRKLLNAGLVRITRQKRRAGAPIKFYRATARAFFVPTALSDTSPTDALNRKMRTALEQSLAAVIKGVLYTHDSTGVRMSLVRNSECSGAAEIWCELQLGEKDAADLAEELRRLLQRYASRRGSADARYIVHAAIARA
jgi:predicted ArsR family transcriptional regulator